MSEILLKEILGEIKSMKTDMQSMKIDIHSMKTEISIINNRLDHIEGRQKENTDIIKAVLHRTEELDAKIDGLLHTTATKDAISRLDVKMDILNDRLFNQEADIRLLKRVL